MRVFNLPDLGEGLQEAEIVEWHVKPGDALASDQTMVALETDKAIVEVPAPYAGKVEKLFGAPGDKIHVGAPLVGFEGAAADSGTIVGDLSTKSKPAQAKSASAPRTEVKATPAVRALARSLNVELAAVAPSGPGGTVTTEDVKRAARGPAPAQPSAQKGMRATMARTMALAHQEVAAVTVIDDADVEHWPKGTSALARLARAIVVAAKAEPGLNAWYDAKADARTLREELDLGVAVDLPDGLLVPVLRNAHRIPLENLARELEQLVAKARERSLSPEMLRGATITLSNFGAIGGRYASPIVVPPQVAIVGAGRIAPQPVVTKDGALAAHRVLPLSLTFDHRAATGGEAARFLNALKRDLES
ncbi:MAG TPA: dihydrolipoamide acetyltransferase family protein [Burkholderiales bacterium]|nr:dihydrolipoamide acetyltransferase family protein [Burkholderiales bacterium]